MASFSELQARVRRNIIDLPTQVSAAVPDLINAALSEVMEEHDFWFTRSQSDLVTTLNTRVLGAVPSDFRKYRGEPWDQPFTDGAKPRPLSVAAHHEGALKGFSPTAIGSPRVLVEGLPSDTGARNWEVYPLPDGTSDYVNGEFRISIPYYRYPLELVNDGDTNWITANAVGAKFLEYHATGAGFFLDWDETRGAAWMQRAEISRKRLIKLDKMQVVSQTRTLVPHISGVNAPLLRT